MQVVRACDSRRRRSTGLSARCYSRARSGLRESIAKNLLLHFRFFAVALFIAIWFYHLHCYCMLNCICRAMLMLQPPSCPASFRPPPHAAATATAIKFQSAVGSAPAFECAHMQPRTRLHSPDCTSRARRRPQPARRCERLLCARPLHKEDGQLHRRRRQIILSRLFHP